MKKLPTADEFYDKSDHDSIIDIMIDFAKLHVEAALKEASEKAETIHDGSVVAELCNMSGNPKLKDITLNDLIWKPSILNAYPLTNIK